MYLIVRGLRVTVRLMSLTLHHMTKPLFIGVPYKTNTSVSAEHSNGVHNNKNIDNNNI